ncbi:DMT family transporter [Maritimibacter sp. DP1N21-5]|uniref:DMT family transporter n=1 Tax=Maritimibacter sp. DP1N21-5 TaxID=2836867 RepID=UPI001C448413|nr:DMT family transporter [Maritimibacter sp. DP1N21-5]MBV7410907.1 DMT family transporter [Maritimibacter sp. DP1N21-5]
MDMRAIIMGLAFALMWSSAFTSARIIVADAPPMTALALRFVISGVMAMGLAALMGQKIRLTRAQWISVVVFGVCQNALYLGLNFIAMQTIEAGFASIIASTMPLIVGVLGWLVFRDRLPWLAVAGLVVGFVGVALIMGSRISGGVDMYGLALCVIAAVALAIATLSVRGASGGGNLLMIVGLQMLVGALTLAPFAAALEPFEVNWNGKLLAAFAYTTLVPGLAATWVWFELVQRIGAVRAATFHFLNPFFGVAIAAVLLGERLGWLDVLGVAIVTAGILAVQLAKQKPMKPVTADQVAS